MAPDMTAREVSTVIEGEKALIKSTSSFSLVGGGVTLSAMSPFSHDPKLGKMGSNCIDYRGLLTDE
jgi:hypothetical protein